MLYDFIFLKHISDICRICHDSVQSNGERNVATQEKCDAREKWKQVNPLHLGLGHNAEDT